MKHWVTKNQILQLLWQITGFMNPWCNILSWIHGYDDQCGRLPQQAVPCQLIHFFFFWQASSLRPTQWAYSTQSLHKQKCVDSSIFRFFKSLHVYLSQAHHFFHLLFFFSPLKSFQNVCFIFPQFLYQFFCGFSQQVSNLYCIRATVCKHTG